MSARGGLAIKVFFTALNCYRENIALYRYSTKITSKIMVSIANFDSACNLSLSRLTYVRRSCATSLSV